MRRVFVALSMILAAAAAIGSPARAQNPFSLIPGPLYANIPSSASTYQFAAEVRSPIPSGEEVMVEFELRVPQTWFAQFCQESTGICYFGGAAIDLPGLTWDRILVDFFVPPGDTNMGWVNMRIYRIMDPGTFSEVTYALGHGVTLPASAFAFRATDLFHQANPMDSVELPTTIQSYNAYNDSLICLFRREIPQGWFAQYCQTSTGICYFEDATIPFPAFAIDQVRVDFFCQTPDPAIGNVWLTLQSRANPAIRRTLPFRVRTGSIPSSVEEVAAGGFEMQVSPHPVRTTADLRILLDRPSALELRIVDLAGRLVHARTTPVWLPGAHEIRWDAKNDAGLPLPSGIYFYRLSSDGREIGGKIIVER